ncbi:MAG: hypothetical protein P8Y12_09595 [Gammaproteobacteria bacterium]
MSALASPKYQSLRPGLEHVELQAGEVLYEPGGDIKHDLTP